MKIATYNANGINGRQELKAPQEKSPLQAINDAGYTAIWHGQKSWNGVAIPARNAEILEVRNAIAR